MSLKTLIELTNVTAGYRNNQILKNINWKISKGQHWIISGNMGSGKTTLAKTLLKKTRIFSGNISHPFLKNQDSITERTASIEMVSFTDTSKLFNNINEEHYYQQRYNAFDAEGYLTAREYLKCNGYNENNNQHNRLLTQLNVLSLLDLERIKLSSGQTRKLILCKALLHYPKILILDNPYIGLDAKSRNVFNEILDDIVSKNKVTLILSGHGTKIPKCINYQINLFTGKIDGINIIDKNKAFNDSALSMARSDPPKNLVAYFKGNRNKPSYQKVLRFKNVNIQYEKKTILQKINWDILPGEKWALLGPNGSGKSTILSLIYGDHPQAYANQIYLFDKKRGSGESIWDIKKRIGFTSPELHTFFKYNFTAREIVLTGYWDGFIIKQPSREQEKLIDLFFQHYNINEKMNVRFNNLSTGEQRLLFFIRALIKASPVLLLDEPFQGFDQQTIEKSKLLLSKLLLPYNTLIFITHFKKEIPEIVDKIFKLKSQP